MLIKYLGVFLVGGIFCIIAQIILDKTKLTPAHVLVGYVTLGVFLGAIGVYDFIVKIGGAGATIPLPGFGYALSKGVIKEVRETGLIGVFTGGIKGTAGGITAAIVFGYLMALLFKAKTKE